MRSRCVVFNVVFCAFLCVFSAWCFCVPFRVFSFFNSTTMLLHVIQTIFTIAGMGSTKDETTTTLLTAHCSLLTVSRLPHHSPHTIHHSPLTTHHSPLTTHHYVHHSPLTTLTTHCPLTRLLKCGGGSATLHPQTHVASFKTLLQGVSEVHVRCENLQAVTTHTPTRVAFASHHRPHVTRNPSLRPVLIAAEHLLG